MIATFTIGTPAASEWMDALRARREQAFDAARDAAAKVAREVREGGDAAVASIVARVDGARLAPDALSIEPRRKDIDPALSAAADLAIARIRSYHERQVAPERPRAGELVERVRPLRRVAVYVPGGRAVYLSTLIMGAVPALLAGVEEIVVLTTPAAAATPELGEIAARLGIRAIYRGGGAGIAAAAYGTASLPAVDKIVGPGSQFVTALKQYLYGRVGIDMTAGPSEIAVIADESAEPELVAADLLAQSEHGPDSAAVAVVIGSAFAPALRAAIERRAAQLPSDAIARRSLGDNGAIAIARTAAEGVAFVNALAPEHVSVQVRDADAIIAGIENSGAIFVGRFSPVAIGDYTAGPNHILPTAGGGRFFSPLGVKDFLKSAHVVALSRETFAAAAPAAEILALREGLPLHAASIAAREGR